MNNSDPMWLSSFWIAFVDQYSYVLYSYLFVCLLVFFSLYGQTKPQKHFRVYHTLLSLNGYRIISQRSIFTLLISSFNRMTFAFLSFYRSFHINVLCLLILFVSSSLFHFFVLITLTHKVVYSQQFRNWAEYLVLYRRKKTTISHYIYLFNVYNFWN